jgi:hypothetical protein
VTKLGPRLPAIPLSIWVQHTLDKLAREYDWPSRVLADRLGISERQIYCWERQEDSERVPAFSFYAKTVEDALARGEVGMWEVFPEPPEPGLLREGYCTRCDEIVSATTLSRCVWCDGPIVRASSRAERIVRGHMICIGCRGRKGRGSLRCKSCAVKQYPRANGKIAGGSVTSGMRICPGCGGPKSHDAMRCRTCFFESGGSRGIRHLKGRLKRMSEELLIEAHGLYDSGLDMPQVRDRIFDRTEYPNKTACENGLYRAFRYRGWPTRSKSEINLRRWEGQRAEQEAVAA